MWQVLASGVDFLHALFMATWILGLPLLFWRRWPRLTKAYAVYAVGFVTANVVSHLILGECFMTTIARYFWQHPSSGSPVDQPVDEWFTVRLAEAVFHMAPSHRAISLAGQALILVTAVGVLLSMRRARSGPGDVLRRLARHL
jgi:asparagine N-glycosylation enzyme membrane subunit Stt3